MGIRFGTVGSPTGTPKAGTPAAIAYSRQIGLSALELGWVRSVRITDAACEEIKQAAAAHDVRLSVHASYYINLNSQDAEKMAASDERLLTACRKGYLAGAHDIIFHPGSYHEQPPKQVYERVEDKLRQLRALLDAEGVAAVLRPETMGKTAMFGTLEEVVALSKAIPGVQPCIDVAHLHARHGDGGFNTYDEFAAALELVSKELGVGALKTLHFHLSGIEYGPKGEKNHVPLEDSDLRWRDFLQACIDYGVEGSILGESPVMEADALLSQNTYHALLEQQKA